MLRSGFSRGAVTNRRDGGSKWARVTALVWGGMVLGVSFIATPAKFRVKSLSRSVALDVGRQTFRTFGRVELIPAAFLGLSAAASQRPLAAMAGAIVLAQMLWLRPHLAARTEQIVQGRVSPSRSRLHLAYVASEMAKLGVLLGLGLAMRRTRTHCESS